MHLSGQPNSKNVYQTFYTKGLFLKKVDVKRILKAVVNKVTANIDVSLEKSPEET